MFYTERRELKGGKFSRKEYTLVVDPATMLSKGGRIDKRLTLFWIIGLIIIYARWLVSDSRWSAIGQRE